MNFTVPFKTQKRSFELPRINTKGLEGVHWGGSHETDIIFQYNNSCMLFFCHASVG
jgi:hypothetical protein